MSSFSDYLENATLNHVFRNTPLTSPAAVYVALYTAAPTDAGGGTQVSGGGYARQAVTFGAPSGGVIANTAPVAFTVGASGWGNVTHIGYFDAATGGNLLSWAPLLDAQGQPSSASLQSSGDGLSFAAGSLTISLT